MHWYQGCVVLGNIDYYWNFYGVWKSLKYQFILPFNPLLKLAKNCMHLPSYRWWCPQHQSWLYNWCDILLQIFWWPPPICSGPVSSLHCHSFDGYLVAPYVHTFHILALGCRFVVSVTRIPMMIYIYLVFSFVGCKFFLLLQCFIF